MSRMSKAMFVASLFALVLMIASVTPATAQVAERGAELDAAASTFEQCCVKLKADLGSCKKRFKDDPDALAICRAAAFAKFNRCTEDLLADFGVVVFGEAATPAGCLVQLPSS